jgi:eukaryotic-like serine/threonine-protein kinase
VSLGGVSARFLVGVGAWLLGAGAATGGSLLAVSLLGQSLAPAGTQQLTSAAVNQALASAAPDSARATPPPSPSPKPSPTPARRHNRSKPAVRPTPPAAAQPTTTVLTSEGGSVVAECQSAGAYLVSWNPNSGYQVIRDTRGPTAKAKVTFSNYNKDVLMVITCSGGVPSANTFVQYHDE